MANVRSLCLALTYVSLLACRCTNCLQACGCVNLRVNYNEEFIDSVETSGFVKTRYVFISSVTAHKNNLSTPSATVGILKCIFIHVLNMKVQSITINILYYYYTY